MNTSLRAFLFLSTLLPVHALAGQTDPLAGQADPLAGLPVRFVPNHGQWSSPELYRVHAGGVHMFVGQRGWTLSLLTDAPATAGARFDPAGRAAGRRSVGISMQFAGAGRARIEPEQPLPGVTSYLGPAGVRTAAVPGYASLLYRQLYPGVDVRLRGAGGQIEYDLLVARGAHLDQVRVAITGARGLRVDADGSLLIDTALGTLRQPRPDTWSVKRDGTRRPLQCEYVLLGAACFGLRAAGRDLGEDLVVDPPLVYSSYLGGSGVEIPHGVTVDAWGRFLVYGRVDSVDFPTTLGVPQRTHAGGSDGFLVCLDQTKIPAQLDFATYFGGAGDDSIDAVVESANGDLHIAGTTQGAAGWIHPAAFQIRLAGGRDVFVGVLDGMGSKLLGGSYLGGSRDDDCGGLVLLPSGEMVVFGSTASPDFPVTQGAYDTTLGGTRDAFVAVLDARAFTRRYATFVGGQGVDHFMRGVVTAQGTITCAGYTSSADFPTTTGAFDRTFNGGSRTTDQNDAVVVQLDPGHPTSALRYSSYIGGTGDEMGFSVGVQKSGVIVVSGTTNSADLPTTADSFQPRYAGRSGTGMIGDAYLVGLDPRRSGSQGLVFGTFFGGSRDDQGLDCAVDSDGAITLVGWTSGQSDLPTTPDADRRTRGGEDGYVARFSADGRQLLFATLYGSSATQGGEGLYRCAWHRDGVVLCAGLSFSPSVPTTINAVQRTMRGPADVVVAEFQTESSGTRRRGSPTAGPAGRPTIHALGDAATWNQAFGIACSRVTPQINGVLVVGLVPSSGIDVLGARVFIDLGQPHVLVPVRSDQNGETVLTTGYPQAGPPVAIHCQYAWFEAINPPRLSASDALEVR